MPGSTWQPKNTWELHKFKHHVTEKVNKELKTGRLLPLQSTNYVFLFTKPKVNKVESRFLIDCIPRNEVTISNPTLLPNIKEILNWTAATKFKSKLDLIDGYHNIRIHPDSVKHSTIVTHMGLHDSQVMQQGDKNTPATMMRVINHLLTYQLDRIYKIYIDDIIIATHTYAEHKKRVREIMRVLEKAGMWFNKDKCKILPKRLHILGFIITEHELEPDSTKIESIKQYPRPTTRKKLQRFMVMVNYLRIFCPNLAVKAGPLSELQGGTKRFKWTEMHEESFKQCKEIIQSNRVLKLINHESGEPIYLITDASQSGIVGSIAQYDSTGKIRPAEFHSRKFNPRQFY